MQKQISDHPIKVVREVNNRIGPRKFTEKMAATLTKREAERAIGPNGIRTVEEQLAMKHYQEPVKDLARVVGCYELTVMNTKAFLKAVPACASAQRVVLERGVAVIEVVTKE